jgi:ABC-type bacteriocin/lantibiotic exporter with double-glycine peptidase domain
MAHFKGMNLLNNIIVIIKPNRCRVFLLILVAIYLSSCAYSPVTNLKNDKLDMEKNTFVDIKFTKQLSSYDCGIACLVSVFNYWGGDYILKNIVSEYPPNDFKSGYSVYELRAIAGKSDFKAFAIKGGIEFIKEQIDNGRPMILAIKVRYRNFYLESDPLVGSMLSIVYDVILKKHGHYVVAVGYNSDNLIIMDPSEGFLYYKFDEIIEMSEYQDNVMILVGK